MEKFGHFFLGLHGQHRNFPKWLYHKEREPVIVHNTEENEKYVADGYEPISPGNLRRTQIINWFWDLEDMSAHQLAVWAKDEFGVEYPEEAGQERLFKEVMSLARNAPKNQDRVVLMAHTIQMNYEQTLETIRKMVDKPSDVTTFELVI